MSGLGAKNSPQRRRIFGGIAISLVTASVLALVAIWVINLAPANIFPSSGVAIPTVTNLTYEQAATKLRAAEFEPVQQDENSVTVAKDKVIRTEPAAGKKLEAGQIVTVVVSLGPKENAVPNVIGMTLADGTAQLTSVQLVAGSVSEAYHGSYPAGTIISTDPAAGASLAEGKTVNIVVANGKVDVPDVRGMSLKDATAKLSSPAFMVPVVTAGDKSCKSDAALTVGAQSVLGEAPLGTSVTIYYCAG
jgi:serine/threonine-protein kinase